MPKFKLVGESVTAGAVPVPVAVSVCGLPAALSVMVSVALRAPAAVGLKVTLKVQLAPAASVAGSVPQVFVWAKSPAFAPPMVMLLMVSVPVPGFVSVTFCAALVVPMA